MRKNKSLKPGSVGNGFIVAHQKLAINQINGSGIWTDISDPLMAGLKQSPRPLQGHCATCAHQSEMMSKNLRVYQQQCFEVF